MEPNDLPIVCLPLELCDEAAATLIDFLYTLTEALERHYAGQLLRYYRERDPTPQPPPEPPIADPADCDDDPF